MFFDLVTELKTLQVVWICKKGAELSLNEWSNAKPQNSLSSVTRPSWNYPGSQKAG